MHEHNPSGGLGVIIGLIIVAVIIYALRKSSPKSQSVIPPINNPTVQVSGNFQNKYCHACGGQIDVRAEICPKCGVRQAQQVSGGGRNRVTAGVFALLLGGLGIHKFYLGRIGMGIIYLLFFWTLIPAIIGFIEGIIILSMSDAAFAAKYNT